MSEISLTFPPHRTAFADQDISHTLSLLADEQSRQLLQMHHELLSNSAYVNNFSQIDGSTDCYRHPKVGIEKHEQIISINPFLGRPLQKFVSATDGQCKVHCFEENPLQYMQLCKNLIDWKIEQQVIPVCATLSSDVGMLAVEHLGGSGHYNMGDFVTITEQNREDVMQAVYANTLDQYVEQTGFIPSLIECTRPGLAEAIIAGGKDTIAVHKPKLILAASPYSEVAQQLNLLNSEYQIFYSECGKRRAGVFFATATEQSDGSEGK